MPDIDKIPNVLQQATNPYHVNFDNLPLTNIVQRQEIINDAVDTNSQILGESIGTQGTLSNRLAQSINDDGSLKGTAIDEALHNIGYHTDGSYAGVSYVRMELTERDMLQLIQDQANLLDLSFQTASTTVEFDTGLVQFIPSDTIIWSVGSTNQVQANVNFPTSAIHSHYYNLTPVNSNLIAPDYKNYKVTSVATVYIADSLRVKINGVEIYEDAQVYVPPSTGPNGTWTLTSFTSSPTAGTFTLNRAITASDVIRIDFDISLV